MVTTPSSHTPAAPLTQDPLKLAQSLCDHLDARIRDWQVRVDSSFTEETILGLCKGSERDAFVLARAYVAAIDHLKSSAERTGPERSS